MTDHQPTGREIPWWRSPGALIFRALIAATIAVVFGDPIVGSITDLMVKE